jgi:hypothetical protein
MSELSIGILTILAMISTLWWQSQHMSYIDFVYLAVYHPRCVLSSYLKLPWNVWMLLNQLGKNHDLVFMYVPNFSMFVSQFSQSLAKFDVKLLLKIFQFFTFKPSHT